MPCLLLTTIKDSGISKLDQIIVYLKEWMLMESLFKYKCCEVGYAELVFQESIANCFQKILAPKKVLLLKKQLFGKSTWFGKDENLLRLIFEAQIHIHIHIRYFKSLPIATYYLTMIHIKNIFLHSNSYNVGLK